MLYIIKLFLSNIHLLIARTLAEGKWIRMFALFFSVVVLTLVASLILFFAYGGLCLIGKTEGYGAKEFMPSNIFDAAFYLLFTNGGQNLYDGSHWIGIAITSLGIIFIAILTSMFTNYFERIGQDYLSGESTFLMKGHVVIVGTSDVLYSILKSKAKNTNTRFLIFTGRDVIQKRREVLSIDGINSSRIIFMYGDRTSKKDINRLSLGYAKEVFVIGDSEEFDSTESYRDSYNMDCMTAIAENPQVVKLRNNDKKLPCHVMFEYQTTFVAFQFSKMGDSLNEHIDFRPFNFYDMWAQQVLVEGGVAKSEKPQEYLFLDKLPNGYINKDSEESVHLIIIGITKMGIALGIQAAQVCHFPNFIKNKSKRTRITFIDAEADIEFNYFMGRYRNLFSLARHRVLNLTSSNVAEIKKPWKNDESWLDVEWEFIKGRVESPNVQSYIEKASEDRSHVVTIAVCLTRSHKSLATAMFLPQSVYENCLQVLVYQRLSGTIVDSVARQGDDTYRYKNIRPFGMIDCGYDPLFEEEILERAKCVAYVYDSYYRTDGNGKEIHEWDEKLERYGAEFCSYGTYPSYDAVWTRKKVWEKISSQLNALTLNVKLRSIGIMVSGEKEELFKEARSRVQNEIENLQEVEHNRWNMEKLLTGFRALTPKERRELNALWEEWHNAKSSDEICNLAKEKWTKMRKMLKEWPDRAHLDICSFEQLKTCEEEAVLNHDIKLNSAIPYILRKSIHVKDESK